MGTKHQRDKGTVALAFETLHGRYGGVIQASPWAGAPKRDFVPSVRHAKGAQRGLPLSVDTQ